MTLAGQRQAQLTAWLVGKGGCYLQSGEALAALGPSPQQLLFTLSKGPSG